MQMNCQVEEIEDMRDGAEMADCDFIDI